MLRKKCFDLPEEILIQCFKLININVTLRMLDDLPNEILLHVFKYIDEATLLLNVARISKGDFNVFHFHEKFIVFNNFKNFAENFQFTSCT